MALSLSVMILFALLFAGAAQAGSSSCLSAANVITAGFAGPDTPTVSAADDLHKQAPSSHGKIACCSFTCAPGFIVTSSTGDMAVLHRHETLPLSEQSPDTLAGNGLERPPRPSLINDRHA
ncbi:hypothetical protein [Taklimakanibacter albus]|uniref:Uncharacterized protein n=1 Tax=Taklimakanibacter albus TaxID=2800327 RepID=A0ACC5RDL6_9HYPH|nr:hypothetical protein [Aestuariivirga sp. YIM B02566]MBK1870729.1 hypothetical protein [Aestuariivirga sp. YIM B02566]